MGKHISDQPRSQDQTRLREFTAMLEKSLLR